MKRSVLLIAAMLFFMAEAIFAGSIATQRVVNACGFIKGSTTLNLSGQMNDAAMQSISGGNPMAVYNSLDSYLTFPTVFPKTKAGYGTKATTQNVSINAKNGKFKWTEKDATPYFTFVTGEERIKPDKAVLKSKGTIDTSKLAELENQRITVFDKLCSDQRLGNLASLVFNLQPNGKNNKFSYNENDLLAKVSVNSKGKVTAKYTLSPEAAYPAILESEYIFTNKYDYSLEIIGDGDVRSGYSGPDKVEFRVIENNDKFRYFYYKGTKVTNDFMTLDLLEDTEVQAVFGTYDLSFKVVGKGDASAEFIGPEEVELKVTANKVRFSNYSVNGESYLDSEMTLVLEEDTAVEAVFGTYDFSLDVVGYGNASAEFIGPDEVEVKVTENKDKFRYFMVNGERFSGNEMTLVLEEDTVVEVIFGTYDLSLKVVGYGSANTEFIGPDEVEVKVTENKDKFRYFSYKGTKDTNDFMILDLEENTEVQAVFGTYDFSLNIVGNGAASAEFIGSDEVKIEVTGNKDKFRYFSYKGTKETNDFMTLELLEDTEVQAVFGTYDFSLNIIGNGAASAVFTGPNEVEVKVTENIEKFRFFTVNGERCSDTEMTLSLEEDTVVEAAFGNYDLSVTISGKGSVSYEFFGPDEVLVKAVAGEEFFKSFEWDENISYENPLKLTLTKDTELLVNFKKAGNEKYIVIDLSGGPDTEFYPVSLLDDVPEGGWTEEYKTTKLVLRKIEPGTFIMGSPEIEFTFTETEHQVTLTNAYYIGVFETTQKQYELISGTNTSSYAGDMRPVENVSYNMIRGNRKGSSWPQSYDVDEDSFLGKLRSKTQMIFDLPTEAQWEYACRAGTTTDLNDGNNITNTYRDGCLAKLARYWYNCNDSNGGYSEHTKVGSYKPNAWGLYDMHGNVSEWCLDWWFDCLGEDPVTEPLGAISGYYRVCRGGSWDDGAIYCRSSSRLDCYKSRTVGYELGFRVILVQNVFSDAEDQIQKDFEFEINSGTENTLPVFEVKLYGQLADGKEYPLEEMGKIEYDGASGIVVGTGLHKLTWIPFAAYTNIMDEVGLRVEYEDVTEQATYLVLDTTSNKMRVSPKRPDTSDDTCRTDELWLRRIEPGIFTMGSPEYEFGRDYYDENEHQVTLTNAYYIGVFEMTQKQFQNIMGFNPSSYEGDMRPVNLVSYYLLRGTNKGFDWPKDHGVDEWSFMGQLRKKAGNIFDLPTEAQWEYACRAGTTTALNSGENLTDYYSCPHLDEVGRYNKNQEDGKGGYTYGPTTVGSYLPNFWGLYDMHGNVGEWCLDWYDNYKFDETEPKGAGSGFFRVIRGGSCDYYARADYCRSASRNYNYPEEADGYNSINGFRVALVQNVFPGPNIQIHKDFIFDIKSGAENTLPVFEVKLYGKLANGTEYPLNEMGKIEYDGSSGIVIGAGMHKLIWTPYVAYTNIMDEVELRVEYKDVTEQATYLVLDTTSNKMRVSSEGPDTADDTCRMDELWLRRIEPGTFTMGRPKDELGFSYLFSPETQHEVTLTKAYYIGVFEMTQKQFVNIVDFNNSEYNGATRPVEDVSYNTLRGKNKGSAWPNDHGVDETSFMGQLRKKAGNIFDLPTEAQWEYACRAGTTTALNSGKNLTDFYQCPNMDKVGRYYYNGGSNNYYAVVGSYLPNAWGLYDMHGNLEEWCLDWYQEDLGTDPVTDPLGPISGDERMLRGGGWYSPACICRSAYRGHSAPNSYSIGFRVVIVQ